MSINRCYSLKSIKKNWVIRYGFEWFLKIETRNSKGRSGSDFYWFLKIYFDAFSHPSPGEMQIWLTHQSKAIILFFDTEKFLSPVFEIFRETDKVNFTNSNLMCVYTHIKFQNMKFCLSVSHKISKKRTQKYFCVKIENHSFRLMGYSYICISPELWCEKAAK